MLHNAEQIADSYFKLPQKGLPLFLPLSPLSLPPFSFPISLQVVSGHVLLAWGGFFYLVLSPRLCLGTDLCVWLCLHWIQRAHAHLCMHTQLHMQALFSPQQRVECRFSSGTPCTYWFCTVVALITFSCISFCESFLLYILSSFVFISVYFLSVLQMQGASETNGCHYLLREHSRNTMALAGCPDYFLHHSNYQVII